MNSLQQTFQQAYRLHQSGQLHEAEKLYHKILKHYPQHPDILNLMGLLASKKGNHEAALQWITQAKALQPENPWVCFNMGVQLFFIGDREGAERAFLKSLSIEPNNALALTNMAIICKEDGRVDAAISYYEKALKIKPDYAKAYHSLSTIKKFRDIGDPYIQSMLALLARSGLSPKDEAHLHFALGKACEDLKLYNDAFEHFFLGNAIRRKELVYNVENDERLFCEIEKIFNGSLFSEMGDSSGRTHGITPIFIVGMPRSGTTLVEQILSSHPDVYGAGELQFLWQALHTSPKLLWEDFPGNVLGLGRDDIEGMATAYIKQLSVLTRETSYATDKNVGNFKYIGMIRLLFPYAKIIQCVRNPLDVCLSCFKHDFGGPGVGGFNNTLDELGRFYKSYERLMRHWHTVLPEYIHDVHYESLVSDQHKHTEALLQFCGLPWDDQCLSFYTSKRAIRTASHNQVNKPIYTNAVAYWKNYEKQLKPLINILRLP